MTGEVRIDLIDTPDDATIISSDFLMRNRKVKREEKKVTTGNANIVKFKKL